MSDADAAAAEAEAAAGGESLGLDTLVATLKAQISVPQRNADGPLHRRPLLPDQGAGDRAHRHRALRRGARRFQEIEFPELRQTRKVKSMQMFRQPVQYASQGDRLGLCVLNSTQRRSSAASRARRPHRHRRQGLGRRAPDPLLPRGARRASSTSPWAT